MKTTFDFNFDFFQAFKEHGMDKHEHENNENLSVTAFLCFSCKLLCIEINADQCKRFMINSNYLCH